MFQSLKPHPNDVSSLKQASLTPGILVENLISRGRLNDRKLKNLAPKCIELADISDEVINRILELYFLTTKRNPCQIRLLNKRLAALALPYSLRTISVSSPEALCRLVLAPQSPLYYLHLGRHVRCFELSYIPQTFRLLDVDGRMTQSFPNLDTIRFKLTLGVLVDSGEALQASICQDTLFRSVRLGSDAFMQRFLSQLRPRRFEWVSTEPRELYLVGVYPMLRSLFYSWEDLSSIYLEGICLIEQPSLTTWRVALFADRVHIKAVFSKAGLIFLDGLRWMQDSDSSCLFLLEESLSENERLSSTTSEQVPVLTYGNTMVSLKHWSPTNRKKLKDCVLGRPPPPSSFHNASTPGDPLLQPVGVGQSKLLDSRFAARLVLVLSVFIMLGIFHAFGPQNGLLSKTHLSLFDTFGGPYAFSYKSFLWILCHDGSHLAKRICADDSSLWFPDRSLMLRPT